MALWETGPVQQALVRVTVHLVGTAVALVALLWDKFVELRARRS